MYSCQVKMVTIVKGDLLQAPDDYIVQQCNCLTVRAHGLSAAIAVKFPEANVYKQRRGVGQRNLAMLEDRGKPGTIVVMDRVINLLAQWRPGKVQSGYAHIYPESSPPESELQRQLWFQQCLETLALFLQGQAVTLAFPYGIGCGLAGGDWTCYLAMIQDFAKANTNLKIKIYKLLLRSSIKMSTQSTQTVK